LESFTIPLTSEKLVASVAILACVCI